MKKHFYFSKDYFNQNCLCNICFKGFVYTAEEQAYQCEKNGKYFWRVPNYCPEHEALFTQHNSSRIEMNKSINLYFQNKQTLDDTYGDVIIYFSELKHKVLTQKLSKKVTDDAKIAYIKLATRHNSKDEMVSCLRSQYDLREIYT